MDGVQAEPLDCGKDSGAKLPAAESVDKAHHQVLGSRLLRHACALPARRGVEGTLPAWHGALLELSPLAR